MKNRIKRIGAMAVAVCLLLSCTVTSFAAVSHLTLNQDGANFNFKATYNGKREDESDYGKNTIFANFSEKSFIPGEIRQDKVEITNNTDKKVTFGLRVSFTVDAKDNKNAKDLANKMLLKLNTTNDNGEMISKLSRKDGADGVWIGDLNGGKALGTDGNKNAVIMITLGTFAPGETRTVNATVEYVGERASNDDLNTEIHTKWQIAADPGVDEITPDPKPEVPDKEDPDKPTDPEEQTPDPDQPPLPPALDPDDIPRYSGDGDRDTIEVVYLDPTDEEFIIFDDETPLADLPLTGGKTGLYLLIIGVAAVAYGSYSFVKMSRNKD